jgi:hypothetical protein
VTQRIESHRNGAAVDLKAVRTFLVDMGYEPIDLAQQWRHVTGIVTSEKKRLFFKLASSLQVAPRTENEIVWYERMMPILDAMPFPPFDLPKVVQTGVWRRRPFFLADEIPGRPLGDARTRQLAKDAARHVPNIAKACAFIFNSEIGPMPRDASVNDSPSNPNLYKERLRQWAGDSGRDDAVRLVPIAERWLREQLVAPSHGDFTPDHIYVSGSDLWLVDAEAASGEAPIFYDAAYFYHRVYTKYGSPEVAEMFRASYRAQLPEESKRYFDAHFRIALALRAVGGWRDLASDGTDEALHRALTDQLLDR